MVLLLRTTGSALPLREAQKEVMDSFEEIFVTHRSTVERVCYGILRNREDMQDAVQDTFLNIFRGLESFRGESTLSTWVGNIARNVALSHLRKRPAVEIVSIYDTPGDGLFTWEDLIPDLSLSPETQIFFSEVMQMVAELPEETREPFVLMLQGYKQQEICAMVGMISAAMIRGRIFRARKRIQSRARSRPAEAL
jgi:RNA polymerase sigma-70 factor (ECF subfamily)